jgi:hypothetical protein
MDPSRHVAFVDILQAEETDQDLASNPANFLSIRRLSVRQEQNWEKDEKVGDKGSMVLLHSQYLVSAIGEVLRSISHLH